MRISPPNIVLRKHRSDLGNFIAYNITTGQSVNINESAYNALILSRHGVNIEHMFENDHLSKLIEHGLLINDDASNFQWKKHQLEFSSIQKIDRVDFPFCEFPYEIELKITNACNFRCVYCFASDSEENNNYFFINPEIIDKLFSEAEARNICRIIITGGEPFVHPHIADILFSARTKCIRFVILTNGSIVNKYKNIIDSENFHFVISLDSSCREINDKLRSEGSYDSALNAVKSIKNAQFSITTVVTKENLSTIEDTIDFVSNLNPIEHNITTIENIGRAEDFETLSAEDILFIEEVISASTNANKVLFYNYKTISPRESGVGDKIFCSAGVSKCAIIPNGNVLPCLYAEKVPELHIGNIYTNSIFDIWNNQNGWKLFRGGITVYNLKKCNNCKLSETCSIKNCRVRFIKNISEIYNVPRWCGLNIKQEDNYGHPK